MRKYEQIKIGDREQLTHQITQSDIEKFIQLTGDDNRLHVDTEFALRTSLKKPVVHGMLGASFISTVIGTRLPGDGALWFSQSLEFILPVRVGDLLTISAEVIGKNDYENIISLRTEIFNQHHQKVTSGEARVKVFAKEEESIDVKTEKAKKTAIVFGASGGIGRAVARHLANDGFQLVLHFNKNSDVLEPLTNEFNKLNMRAKVMKADLLLKNEIDDLVYHSLRWFGNIDVVVNCAMIALPTIKYENMAWEEIDSQFKINVQANFNITKAVIPGMKEQKSGKIIFLTSQSIENTPPTGLLHYVTAKSALNGFARSLAIELSPFNINVNMVSPGMTDTDLIANFSQKGKMLTAARTPLRRLAKGDDVAAAVAYLASEKTNYITGETIRVNGGISMV